MLEQSLEITRTVLNQYLTKKFGLNDDVVVINNVIDPNGSVPQSNLNKVVISLLNIEREVNKQFYNRNQKLSDGTYADINPEERYNLDLLFSSSFQNYSETLKFLNGVLEFFQINNTIDSRKYSNMPSGINRLDYDNEKISFHQMHSLWSAMGAKYQPSVIYKLRLITIQGDELIKVISPVSATSNSSGVS